MAGVIVLIAKLVASTFVFLFAGTAAGLVSREGNEGAARGDRAAGLVAQGLLIEHGGRRVVQHLVDLNFVAIQRIGIHGFLSFVETFRKGTPLARSRKVTRPGFRHLGRPAPPSALGALGVQPKG